MIDAGSNGLCILANFSEQFVLSDDDREVLTKAILEHVAGRVPVIAGAGSNSTAEAIELVRHAKTIGADAALEKPVPPSDLVSAVADALSRPPRCNLEFRRPAASGGHTSV